MSKTRINLYLESSLGDAFKRYCRSHRLSYSEVMERVIYRFLISRESKAPDSSLTTIQNEIHDHAVQAYREVYDSSRQEVIETAVRSSDSEIDDVSPQIPMPIPYPTTEVNNHGTRTTTRRLSKRQIR